MRFKLELSDWNFKEKWFSLIFMAIYCNSFDKQKEFWGYVVQISIFVQYSWILELKALNLRVLNF